MRINNLPKRLLLTLWGVILGASLLSAQNKTVKGVVLDETDQGVIGAAVMIKGTTTGVATDIDGAFEINCAPSDVLVVTSIGYKDVEVTVGDRTNITVKMELDTQILDDVVVIGYGTTRAKNFTGSVDVMKTDGDAPVANLGLSNVADMMRGRLSGVVMGAESANVGGNASIRVRGRRSINSTSPATWKTSTRTPSNPSAS